MTEIKDRDQFSKVLHEAVERAREVGSGETQIKPEKVEGYVGGDPGDLFIVDPMTGQTLTRITVNEEGVASWRDVEAA